MARINVEDDIESQPEFRRLVLLLGGDFDKALGMLIRFWRIAQRHWGEGKLVPLQEIEANDLGAVVTSGWGIPHVGEIYAKGSEERFAWYKQRHDAAVSGGRARSASQRDDKGRYQPAPAGTQPEPSRNPADDHPKTSLLSPVPVPVLKNEEQYKNKESVCVVYDAVRETGSGAAHTHTPLTEAVKINPEEIALAAVAWRETLRHFGMGRTLLLFEQAALGRAILLYGVKAVLLALEGARREPKDERFDPAKFCQLNRYLEAKNFQRFLNLGTKARLDSQESSA